MRSTDMQFIVGQFTALREHFDLRFDQIDRRFLGLEQRIGRVEDRLDQVIDALAAHAADRDMHGGEPS